MLLKRGLIEMVKGQLVINERGYDMMKKAGVPPKLTPEERREEIMGTEEEKRLSRFDHRGHREHRVAAPCRAAWVVIPFKNTGFKAPRSPPDFRLRLTAKPQVNRR
ncbi:MAG: hypothetical protein EBY32_15370 [Proteobacteria bacterium]|nr:hypothetical protein [Pseudomonadota bacterium]